MSITAEKQKALKIFQDSMEKKYGSGTIRILGGDEVSSGPRNSTGIPSLDWATGGGFPKGKFIEIYGPESSGKTTLTLHAIAEAQKAGDVCAFIDAEHALDVKYASSLGVNINDLVINQPTTAEEALDIVEELTNSGIVDLIVVDSVAALVPKAELEGEMGDQQVGLHARLMSKACRKITGAASKNNVTVIWINQIRMKIGVMFGCFHYDARVLLADGTTEKIGKIVNQEKAIDVLSVVNGEIVKKPIVAWHENGQAKQFWQVVTQNPHGSGRSNIPVGDDHIFITPTGEKSFTSLKIGDEVLLRAPAYFTKDQIDICIGSTLGDGSIDLTSTGLTAALRLGHGINQNSYCQEKRNHLSIATGSEGYSSDKFWFQTKPTHEIAWLAKYKKDGAIRFVDKELLDKLTLRAIAIWYLDDGSFNGTFAKWGWGKSIIYATKLSNDSKNKIADKLVDLGLPRPSLTKKGLLFSGKKNKEFQEKIAEYCYPSMAYKIHPKFQSLIGTNLDLDKGNLRDELISVKILDIYKKPPDTSTLKFDITVQDGHSYFIDDVLVHNSPETTTGGNALKFYSSIRLDVRRRGQIKDGEEIIATETEVKVVKNKTAPPYRVAEFQIEYGKGVNKTLDLLRIAVNQGVVEKSGAWYSFKGERIGQGEKNSSVYIDDHADIKALIVKLLQQASVGESQLGK
jgi:recombination protein RecA